VAQTLKPEVRERILRATLEAVAERGLAGATVAAIAARAGVAGGNVYRYFPNKDELFAAALPRSLARRHDALVAASARSLSWVATGDPPGSADARDALLRFWIEHRLAVVVLLLHDEGTPYEGYARRFVDHLTALTVREIEAAHPGVRVSAEARSVLAMIFDSTRRTVAGILATHADEVEIRRAIAVFRSYQVAGLGGLAAFVAPPPARARRPRA
jgi:AcrR family transcriptional regulator